MPETLANRFVATRKFTKTEAQRHRRTKVQHPLREADPLLQQGNAFV